MEKAIHVTNLKNLKYFYNDKYDRLYWGVEFCQNLIPNLKDTERILRFVRENGIGFTYVSPFITEQGFRKLNEIFLGLKKKKINCEVVVNDWGVLDYLHNKMQGKFDLVLGRLLVRQQRDPVMKRVFEKQLPFAIRGKDGKIRILVHKIPSRQYQQGMRMSYINSSSSANFLSKFSIKRVELNNLIQGFNVERIRFKKSLYTPYVHISTTRFCPMRTRFQKTYRINVCKRECQDYYDILRCKAVPKIIYKRGNTAFYKNPVNIKDAEDKIDRIVFQPEMPF